MTLFGGRFLEKGSAEEEFPLGVGEVVAFCSVFGYAGCFYWLGISQRECEICCESPPAQRSLRVLR